MVTAPMSLPNIPNKIEHVIAEKATSHDSKVSSMPKIKSVNSDAPSAKMSVEPNVPISKPDVPKISNQKVPAPKKKTTTTAKRSKGTQKATKVSKRELKKSEKAQRALLVARLRIDKLNAAAKLDAVTNDKKDVISMPAAVPKPKKGTSKKATKTAGQPKEDKKTKQEVTAKKSIETKADSTVKSTRTSVKSTNAEETKTKTKGLVKQKALKQDPNAADKYAAIDDLGERAFAILTDIGVVERTIDPSSPDYDSSKDDEIADENIYVNFKK